MDNRVQAINVNNKPNEVQQKNWLIKNEFYTPVKLLKSKITGQQFFVLEEVAPDPPYGGYSIERFAIPSGVLKDLFGVEVEEIKEEILTI